MIENIIIANLFHNDELTGKVNDYLSILINYILWFAVVSKSL